MQELILRSDVEKMIQNAIDLHFLHSDKDTLYGILDELSQLESKYEAVANNPEYMLANRIWKSIDTPPHTE